MHKKSTCATHNNPTQMKLAIFHTPSHPSLDKKIDDDDDTFTNTSTSLTDKEPKLTQLASPAQPVAREQPHVAREEPTEPNKESLSDDAVKSALAIMASKPPPTRKRKLVTISVHCTHVVLE